MIFKKPNKRSVLYLVLSIVLAASAVSIPFQAFAQEATPAVSSDTGSAPAVDRKAKRDAEEKAEREETNTYRHSPTVEWISHTFHLDIEQTALLFEFINFAIIALAVGIPLIRILPKVLRQRSARLTAEIEVAQAKTADANERLNAVEAKLAGLDSEIAAIRMQVEEDMKSDEARAKTLLQEESARIVAAAEQEIVMAGTLAQRGLKQFAADLAIDRAMSQLTLDADTDRALIAEFAGDLNGKASRGKGGN